MKSKSLTVGLWLVVQRDPKWIHSVFTDYSSALAEKEMVATVETPIGKESHYITKRNIEIRI